MSTSASCKGFGEMDRPLVDMVELVGRFFELARECEVTHHTCHIVTTCPSAEIPPLTREGRLICYTLGLCAFSALNIGFSEAYYEL